MADRQRQHHRDTSEGSDGRAVGNGYQAVLPSPDLIRNASESFQQFVQAGLDLAKQINDRSADQIAVTFGLTRDASDKALGPVRRNVETTTSSSVAPVQSLEDLSREWFDSSRRLMDHNLEKLAALINCRTPQDVVAIQSDLWRENLETWMNSNCKLVQMSLRLVEGARSQGG